MHAEPRKGFTLLEFVISVGLLAFVVLTSMKVLTEAHFMAQEARNRLLAANAARAVLETVKNTPLANSGVTGGVVVGDGFLDDLDRNNNGVINGTDFPDYHDLTADGGDDSKAEETLLPMSLPFYAAHNNVPAFSVAGTRYLKFVPVAGSNYTRVEEYTTSAYSVLRASYNLPPSAIVYVNGDAYVQGEIEGRVSVAAADDIMITGDFRYTNGQDHADAGHSTALLARDIIYFQPNTLNASGILYGENASNASAAFDSDYNTAGVYDPTSKQTLNLSGNRIIKGSTNLSNYDARTYGYDPNLKYYRPPGIPVVPDLRTVRET